MGDGTLEYPDESTLVADSFVVPDFIVSTSTSVIAHVTTNGTVVDVGGIVLYWISIYTIYTGDS